MNLTEPHAGSDVGALRTKAVKDGNHYKITGEKIYITGGEHDYTENIIHLVLARTPGAPQGNKGISLFIVPKFLINEDSTIGQKNDLRCVSIEQNLEYMPVRHASWLMVITAEQLVIWLEKKMKV